MSLAVRRRLRQGPKGALFDAEIGFVNGTAVANRLRSEHLTIWDFASEFASEVLRDVSMRRATPATLAASLRDDEGVSDAQATRAHALSHIPVCWSEDRKRARAAGEEQLPTAKRGRVCCRAEQNGCGTGEPQRPHYWCPGCDTERGAGWYHWACYWKCHQAVYSAGRL